MNEEDLLKRYSLANWLIFSIPKLSDFVDLLKSERKSLKDMNRDARGPKLIPGRIQVLRFTTPLTGY